MRPSASGKIRSARSLSARRSASCAPSSWPDAEQHEQARADRAHLTAVDRDRRARHALDERAHQSTTAAASAASTDTTVVQAIAAAEKRISRP